MKKSTTKERLEYLMETRHLRQADILRMARPYCLLYSVKLDKNHLSQYLSGKSFPRQDKLSVLSMALHVSEAWLMGYDVPMDTDVPEVQSSLSYALAEDTMDILQDTQHADTKKWLIEKIRTLNTDQLIEVLDHINAMQQNSSKR